MSNHMEETSGTQKQNPDQAGKDYVDQFLSLEGLGSVNFDFGQQKFFEHLNEQYKCRKQKKEKISSQNSRRIEDAIRQQKKQTSHNFQKHLVLTLRKIIKKPQFKGNLSATEQHLIDKFMNAQKLNKGLICMLLGKMKRQPKEVLKNKEVDTELSPFEENQLEQAQKTIRNEMIEQLRQTNFDELVNERRFKNKQMFLSYLNNFMRDLEEKQSKQEN